jgi:DNA-directed RNA polymerase subunit RPC12/RpoP
MTKYYGHRSLGFVEDYFGTVGPKIEVCWFRYYLLKIFGWRVTKMRTVYRWKCQKCGHDWTRRSKDEPIQCPICLDKGAKSFRGKE